MQTRDLLNKIKDLSADEFAVTEKILLFLRFELARNNISDESKIELIKSLVPVKVKQIIDGCYARLDEIPSEKTLIESSVSAKLLILCNMFEKHAALAAIFEPMQSMQKQIKLKRQEVGGLIAKAEQIREEAVRVIEENKEKVNFAALQEAYTKREEVKASKRALSTEERQIAVAYKSMNEQITRYESDMEKRAQLVTDSDENSELLKKNFIKMQIKQSIARPDWKCTILMTESISYMSYLEREIADDLIKSGHLNKENYNENPRHDSEGFPIVLSEMKDEIKKNLSKPTRLAMEKYQAMGEIRKTLDDSDVDPEQKLKNTKNMLDKKFNVLEKNRDSVGIFVLKIFATVLSVGLLYSAFWTSHGEDVADRMSNVMDSGKKFN